MHVQKIFYKQDGEPRVLLLDGQHNLLNDLPAEQVDRGQLEQARIDALSILDPAIELRDELLQELQTTAGELCKRAGNMIPLEVLTQLSGLVAKAYTHAQKGRGRRVVPLNIVAPSIELQQAKGPPKLFQEERRAVVVGVEPVEQTIIERFMDLKQPCFFPGCEDLRLELSQLIEENGGEQCASCTRDRIEIQMSQKALDTWRKSREQDGKADSPSGN